MHSLEISYQYFMVYHKQDYTVMFGDQLAHPSPPWPCGMLREYFDHPFLAWYTHRGRAPLHSISCYSYQEILHHSLVVSLCHVASIYPPPL